MKKESNYKKIIRICAAICTILAIAKIYYDTKLLDLTIGILNLEFGSKKISRVYCKTLMYITQLNDSDQLFIEEMSNQGWQQTDIYGRGHLYEKDGEEILVIVKEYFARYRLYEIQNKHHFLANNIEK